MEEIIFEQESEAPLDWVTDIVLERDNNGNIIEIEVPDDEEVEEDATDP